MKEKIKSLDEIKSLEQEGKIDKKFKIKEIKRCKQKSKKITYNLLIYMLVLGAATILTEALEKDNLLSNDSLQFILYTISLLLRGTVIGAAIVELFRKVKYESLLGYLENLEVSNENDLTSGLSK